MSQDVACSGIEALSAEVDRLLENIEVLRASNHALCDQLSESLQYSSSLEQKNQLAAEKVAKIIHRLKEA